MGIQPYTVLAPTRGEGEDGRQTIPPLHLGIGTHIRGAPLPQV